MQITVRVVDEDDDDRTFSDVRVWIYSKTPGSVLPFGDTESFVETTDDDGEAVFDIDDSKVDTNRGITIEVRGEEYGPYDVEDDGTYTFTIAI